MTPDEKLKYYSRRFVELMNEYESLTGTMMQDSASDLEKACWNSIEEKDAIRARSLYVKLCNLVDEAALKC